MKAFEILSGSAYVVELPETQWPYRNLNYKIRAELGKPLAGKMLVRGSNSLWQEVDLPPGNWRIIGMLSEVTETEVANIMPYADLGDRKLFNIMEAYPNRMTDSAIEALESWILAEGWHFENPVKIHTWASENADDYRKQWEEGKKRVLCRERCLLLGRE